MMVPILTINNTVSIESKFEIISSKVVNRYSYYAAIADMPLITFLLWGEYL